MSLKKMRTTPMTIEHHSKSLEEEKQILRELMKREMPANFSPKGSISSSQSQSSSTSLQELRKSL